MIISKTKFLGIGVPSRPSACPQCRKTIEVDSFVVYDGDKWLGHATFFCSEECLQKDPALEDRSHHRGDGKPMQWSWEADD
jgi:hypothetical protein